MWLLTMFERSLRGILKMLYKKSGRLSDDHRDVQERDVQKFSVRCASDHHVWGDGVSEQRASERGKDVYDHPCNLQTLLDGA